MNSLGNIEKLTFSLKDNITQQSSYDYPRMKASIKDNKANKTILL